MDAPDRFASTRTRSLVPRRRVALVRHVMGHKKPSNDVNDDVVAPNFDLFLDERANITTADTWQVANGFRLVT